MPSKARHAAILSASTASARSTRKNVKPDFILASISGSIRSSFSASHVMVTSPVSLRMVTVHRGA